MTEPAHDCLENLELNESSWTETHGLEAGPFEHCREEWYECTVCESHWTQKEVDRALEAKEQAK